MPKLSLSDITSGYNSSQRINAAFAALEAAMENTVSRDGSSPNTMSAYLDMNSNRILNVGAPSQASDAARWVDVTDALAISTALPAQTGNSGKYITTDGSSLGWGNPPIRYAQTSAESAASVTPTDYSYPPGDIRRYGGVGDGSTDNVTALTSACAQSSQTGGAPVTGLYGTFNLASASLPISISSGCRIYGEGIGTSQFTVTGSSPNTVFTAVNKQKLEFRDFTLRGNSQATTSVNGLAFYFQQTGAASSVGRSYRFRNVRLENFKGDYWINFENTSTTYAMRDFRVRDCEFSTESGNARNGASTSVPSCMIAFYGSTTSTNGLIADARVHGCTADGTYGKTFVVAWQGSTRIKVDHNILKNFGTDASISNDAAAYALFAYDNSSGAGGAAPDMIEFSDNTIDGVKSCGIFWAGVGRIAAKNNFIRGQTDTVDGIIPKGGIAGNQAGRAVVSGNRIDDCVYGIEIVLTAGSTASKAILHDNWITNVTASGFGVKAQVSGSGQARSLVIDGLYIDATAASVTGLRVESNSTFGFKNLAIKNFSINSSTGIILYSSNATVPNMGTTVIRNGEIIGADNYGIQWYDASNAASRTIIENVSFHDGVAGVAYLYLNSSKGLTVRNITFHDMTSGAGYCWYGNLAEGRVEGIRFVNVASARKYFTDTGVDLGIDTPAFTAVSGDFVQNLAPVDVTGATWDYQILGWQYTTSWRAVYAPYQDA